MCGHDGTYSIAALSSLLSTVAVTRLTGVKDQLNIVCLQNGLVDLLLKISDWTEHNEFLYVCVRYVCVCV